MQEEGNQRLGPSHATSRRASFRDPRRKDPDCLPSPVRARCWKRARMTSRAFSGRPAVSSFSSCALWSRAPRPPPCPCRQGPAGGKRSSWCTGSWDSRAPLCQAGRTVPAGASAKIGQRRSRPPLRAHRAHARKPSPKRPHPQRSSNRGRRRVRLRVRRLSAALERKLHVAA